MGFFLAVFLLIRGKQHRHSSGILILVTMRVHQRRTNLSISKLGQFPTHNPSIEIKIKQGDFLLSLGGVNAHVTQGIKVTSKGSALHTPGGAGEEQEHLQCSQGRVTALSTQ